MKVQRIRLDTLKNEELIAFFHQVDDAITSCFGEKGLDLALGFKAKLRAFDESINQIDGAMIEELRAADEVADNVWKGFFYELMAGMKSLNEVRRNAALKVNETFSMISNPTDLPYAEEYACIHKLLGLLDELPEDLMKDARVDDWLFAMHQSYDGFMATNDAHLKSIDRQTFDVVKNAKVEAIAAYRNMIIGVEVIAPIRKNATYDTLLEKIHELAMGMNARPIMLDEE